MSFPPSSKSSGWCLLLISVSRRRRLCVLRGECRRRRHALAIAVAGLDRRLCLRVRIRAVTKIDVLHDFFKATLLPQLLAGATGEVNAQPHTLIFVPSYLDYVRLRNTLLREDVEFTQCCEYVAARCGTTLPVLLTSHVAERVRGVPSQVPEAGRHHARTQPLLPRQRAHSSLLRALSLLQPVSHPRWVLPMCALSRASLHHTLRYLLLRRHPPHRVLWSAHLRRLLPRDAQHDGGALHRVAVVPGMAAVVVCVRGVRPSPQLRCGASRRVSQVLYTKYDALALARVVGSARAAPMLTGEKSTFLFC